MTTRERSDAAAAEFLTSLNQLTSAVSLYPQNHPARVGALDRCWNDLSLVLKHGGPTFSFLEDVVLYGQRELRDLRSWELGSRLYEAGIQRVEIQPDLRPEELDALANHVSSRLMGSNPEPLELGVRKFPNIQIGTLTVRVEPAWEYDGASADEPVQLEEELDVVQLVYAEAGSAEQLPAAEVRLAIESLALTMDSLRRTGSELIAIKSRDQYTAIHCMNVAILSMTFAEHLRCRPDEIRLIGEAALVHDIGKTKTPDEILNKPGVLTPEERKVIEAHTVEGCRLLLESPDSSRLAATVAFEHHMGNGGRGYPSKLYEREPHPVSRLVQVCDVYDALRTRRPFRPPMSAEESLRFVADRTEGYFDPRLVSAFVKMVQEMDHNTPRVQPQTSTIEKAEHEAGAAARKEERSLKERIDAMAEALRAPEPAATVDWLDIL
jgi:putative nucleotidyltransferase with HDIG domain